MIKHSFRHWLALVLLAVLTLQSVWAAAAAYCTHQHDAPGHHFGHHEHRHAEMKAAGEAPSAASAATWGGEDLDCPTCHLSCAHIVSTLGTGRIDSPPRRWSLVSLPDPGRLARNAIERPNWARLA